MTKTVFLAAVILTSISVSCGSDESSGTMKMLMRPTSVKAEWTGNAVKVTWNDNSDGESGFSVLKSENKVKYETAGKAVADAGECEVSDGLVEGRSYYFGVKADGDDTINDSEITWADAIAIPSSDVPSVSLSENVLSTSPSVALTYTFSKMSKAVSPESGICWNLTGSPTISDDHQRGPDITTSSNGESQVISNVLLDYGKQYHFRAYLKSGSQTYYSNEVTASLGDEPSAISLSWSKVSVSGLPSGVEVYSTTDKLNGDNFNAWYAVADLSKVDVKVCKPSSGTATVDSQYSSNSGCCVMTNAGYFYNSSQVGISVVNSVMTGSISDVRGSLRTGDSEYNVMYHNTRGIFGVDASGKPAIYWAGGSQNCFFDRPLPSVKGWTRYAAIEDGNPSAAVSWSPVYAVSAGPVLLYDGKCPLDFTETSAGDEYYLNNFEIIPYDIFGPDVTPDRTAVGYTSDGKVILFVCDGRIQESGGATLTELAMIMNGLGCVAALNLDGGGSTAMVAGGKRLNSLKSSTSGATENRQVVTTIGFFTK